MRSDCAVHTHALTVRHRSVACCQFSASSVLPTMRAASFLLVAAAVLLLQGLHYGQYTSCHMLQLRSNASVSILLEYEHAASRSRTDGFCCFCPSQWQHKPTQRARWEIRRARLALPFPLETGRSAAPTALSYRSITTQCLALEEHLPDVPQPAKVSLR